MPTNPNAGREISEVYRDEQKAERLHVTPAGYSVAEMKAAFNLVCDPDDWKAPIDASVAPSLLDVTMKGIEFMTATKARVVGVAPNGRIRVRANGYRMGPAGDR